MYITAVMGHFYMCWLLTLAPPAKKQPPLEEIAMLLLGMLRAQIVRVVSTGVPVECAQCGQPDHLLSGQRRAELVKVTQR